MKTIIGELTINDLFNLRGKQIRLGKQKDFFTVGAMNLTGGDGRVTHFHVCFWKAPRNVVQKIAKQETEIEVI